MLALAACGRPAPRTPTDEELYRFTTRLDAQARIESEAAISEARRAEVARAQAAEARRGASARARNAPSAE